MSATAERVNFSKTGVSKTGVSFIPTKEGLKKIRFLVPNSNKIVSIDKQRAPRKLPTHIQFGMIRDRQLKMIQAIPVHIERKGKTVVARWDEIEEFGYGRNMSEALDDFGRTLEELFKSLNEKKSSLSEDLTQVWTLLSKHIEFTRRG